MARCFSFWRKGDDRRFFLVVVLDPFFNEVRGCGVWRAVTDDFGNLVPVEV